MVEKEYRSTPSSQDDVFWRKKYAQCVKPPKCEPSTWWMVPPIFLPNMRQAHSPLWIWNFWEKTTTTTTKKKKILKLKKKDKTVCFKPSLPPGEFVVFTFLLFLLLWKPEMSSACTPGGKLERGEPVEVAVCHSRQNSRFAAQARLRVHCFTATL